MPGADSTPDDTSIAAGCTRSHGVGHVLGRESAGENDRPRAAQSPPRPSSRHAARCRRAGPIVRVEQHERVGPRVEVLHARSARHGQRLDDAATTARARTPALVAVQLHGAEPHRRVTSLRSRPAAIDEHADGVTKGGSAAHDVAAAPRIDAPRALRPEDEPDAVAPSSHGEQRILDARDAADLDWQSRRSLRDVACPRASTSALPTQLRQRGAGIGCRHEALARSRNAR